MKSGIYKIVCIKTGHYYIGSSKKIEGRWNSHIHHLRYNKHGNVFMQRVANLHGVENFKLEILEEVEASNLLEKESEYLNEHYGNPLCMNLTKSAIAPMLGISPWNKGIAGSVVHDEDTRKRISKNHARYWKGKPRPDISKKFTGHKVTTETRKKISDSLKGRPISEQTKQKMKNRIPWNKGKKGLQVAWNKGLKKERI